MTVIRLSSGVILHSPVLMSADEWSDVKKIGEVEWILAPNNFHHLYVEAAQKNSPTAKTAIAPGLKKKRKDLKFEALLPQVDLGNEMDVIFVAGSPMMSETVFYHKKSKSLICSDFLHQCDHSNHWSMRIYSKIMGFYEKPSVSRCIRPTFRDKAQANESLSRLLELQIDRIIPAHGKIFEGDCSTVIKTAYAWL